MTRKKYTTVSGTRYWIEERCVLCPIKRRDGTLDHTRLGYKALWFLCHQLKGLGVKATCSELFKSKSQAEGKLAALVKRQMKEEERSNAQV